MATKRTYQPKKLHGQKVQGYDMILVARGRTLTASWKELNDTFLRLCRKLELLEDRS